MVDAEQNTTKYVYDVLNRELSQVSDVPNDSNGTYTQSAQWTYDNPTPGDFGIGRLASTTTPGSVSYAYDVRGLLESEDRFTSDGVSLNQYLTNYRYDANGNRAQLQYPDGQIVSYAYDYADRPYSAQQGTALNAAALHRGVTSLRTEVEARRSFGESSTQAQKFAVEKPRAGVRFRVRPSWEHSRVALSQSRTGLGSSLMGSAPFVRGGLVVGSHRPLGPGVGNRVQIGVEARRRQAMALSGASSSVYVASATYAPFGPLTSITYGNGTVQNLTYTQRYLPYTNTLTAGSTALSNYTYGEDGVGNITSITDNLNAGYDRTFQYDDLNRGQHPEHDAREHDAFVHVLSRQRRRRKPEQHDPAGPRRYAERYDDCRRLRSDRQPVRRWYGEPDLLGTQSFGQRLDLEHGRTECGLVVFL